MWATYDDSNFPIINVKMTGVPNNDKDFQDFLTTWDSYNYNRNNQPYIFIFDTTEVGFINMKYSFRMSSFIKNLKASEHQYLRSSIIIANGMWSKFLLKIIFWTQRPVAPVYLTEITDDKFIKNFANELNQGIEKRYEGVSIIRPS